VDKFKLKDLAEIRENAINDFECEVTAHVKWFLTILGGPQGRISLSP
jgi:hypothetical protein